MLKKFKIGLPLLALVLGIAVFIAASAFKGSPDKEGARTKPAAGTVYFDLTGSNQMDQGSYTKRIAQPSPGNVCPGDVTLCGIWAQEDPNDPGRPLQSDIDALAASYDQDHDGIFDEEHINEVDFKNQ